MAAPGITFTVSGHQISDEAGFDFITVTFQADMAYQAFECRATKLGEDYGVGKGVLVASFSQTPANTVRTFEVYDDDLVHGDGEYRISLFAQGEDGSWNDNYYYIPSESTMYVCADGNPYLCMREATTEGYNGSYTGKQIDAAVGAVVAKETAWDNKQDKVSGKKGQIVGFDQGGNMTAQAPVLGVTIQTGSYVGNGGYGAGSPCAIATASQAKMVIIMGPSGNTYTILLGGSSAAQAWAPPMYPSAGQAITVTWSAGSVSWYAASAAAQMNVSGSVYNYLMFL